MRLIDEAAARNYEAWLVFRDESVRGERVGGEGERKKQRKEKEPRVGASSSTTAMNPPLREKTEGGGGGEKNSNDRGPRIPRSSGLRSPFVR